MTYLKPTSTPILSGLKEKLRGKREMAWHRRDGMAHEKWRGTRESEMFVGEYRRHPRSIFGSKLYRLLDILSSTPRNHSLCCKARMSSRSENKFDVSMFGFAFQQNHAVGTCFTNFK